MITTLRRPVIKRCPYKDETDAGELVIVISGELGEEVPELHALAQLIDTAAAEPVSHENFTQLVCEMLPPGSVVTTRWHTGPWDVECREGAA
jgi:hypothetical protein